jgi:hypothetical protein
MQEIFLFFEASRAHLASKSMVMWGEGGTILGAKELKRKAGLASPCSMKVKKV